MDKRALEKKRKKKGPPMRMRPDSFQFDSTRLNWAFNPNSRMKSSKKFIYML